ncbi:MAG: hypothetical protein IMF08_05545 [Proteobacteria bacterium]|nr:hypothetical protein [Pseudomonadota bacterium]
MNQGLAATNAVSGKPPTKRPTAGQFGLGATAAVLAVGIFAIDLLLPLGAAGGVPYVALVLLGWWFESPRYIILLGAISTVLTILGFFYSPPGGIEWMIVTNRALALFAIWITVILLGRAKAADDRVKAANEVLEHRVEARTAELRDNQAALVRAERLAAMGQLTGTVAHELRNPLGAVATSIAVIASKSKDAELDIERALGRADRGVKRCETIITELLDFARARGHQPQPIVLDSWLDSVLDEITIPGNILLRRDLKTGETVIDIDPESLRRAIINLTDNACQAMTIEGDVQGATADCRLTVACQPNGDVVEVSFADNGPGIPADALPLVLEPLFSTKAFGTGLGLPTVQRIVEEHGGSLRVDSTPGQGTQVTLRLPTRAKAKSA